MSTVVKSAEPCPICLLKDKVSNPLENRPGQFYSNCRAGHKFEDTEELAILRGQARAKFPNLYLASAPAAPDPTQFDATDIVITAPMKQMIEEVSGVKFTGPSDLKGLIFAMVQDNKDKDAELRTMRATMATMRGRQAAGGKSSSLSPDQIIVTIPEWALEGVNAQAEHAGMSPEDWVAQEFNAYCESYFGGVTPGRQG